MRDRALGTGGYEFRLEHFNPDFTHYEPSSWSFLRRALAGTQITPSDVFADLGCGRGKVVVQAARHHPFRRVYGVELVEGLAESARLLVGREAGTFRTDDVEIVTADAAEWEIPDDLTYAYLFQPFSGETMERVIANLLASVDQRPRRLTVLYACPLDADRFLATGRFTLVRSVTTHRLLPQAWGIQVLQTR